jgi:hypothetical protein
MGERGRLLLTMLVHRDGDVANTVVSILSSLFLQYQCQVYSEIDGQYVNNECKAYGPYFAGINEDVCDASGGTYCAVSDCTELMDCVGEMTISATDDNRTAFATYLKSSPNITNPVDPYECGRAREYFGFDESFVNDDQICEDVKQFTNTRDFAFLDEFFDQGGKADEITEKDGLVPPLVLNAPTTST